MNRSLPLYVGLLLAWLALPLEIAAQSFEGVVKQRQITVSEDGLYTLLYAEEEEEEEPEELDAQKVFDLPLERILALAQSPDEGSVELQELIYTVGKNKLRVDGNIDPSASGHVIMDFESGTYWMVHPEEKAFIEVTKDDLAQIRGMYGGEQEAMEEAPGPTIDVRRLGKTKSVAGMTCQAYELRGEEEVSIVWVSAELKDLGNAFAGFIDRMEALGMSEGDEGDVQVMKLVKEHGFPLLQQTVRQNRLYGGATYEITEVLSIERKAPAASLFTIPSDYQKRTFADVMRQMGIEKN